MKLNRTLIEETYDKLADCQTAFCELFPSCDICPMKKPADKIYEESCVFKEPLNRFREFERMFIRMDAREEEGEEE